LGRIGAFRALFCLLAFSAGLQAQQYVFRAYRQPDGLRNLAVNALTSDREGFLWLATENGVYRFLGSSFERFGQKKGIGDLDARDIVADSNGVIWVGTKENLYHSDGHGFRTAGATPIQIPGQRRIAVEDPSHLLIADKGRLYRLEHDPAGRMISYNQVFSERMVAANPALGQISRVMAIAEGAGGHSIWIVSGKKLYSIPDGRLTRMEPGDGAVTEWGKDQGIDAEQWEEVLLDHEGTLWAAGQNHIAVLPRGAKRFVDRSIPGSDPENVYGHAPIAEDSQGRMIVPDDDGIARWNGSAWQLIGRSNGLFRSTRISGMVFDATGDLWLSSIGDGLYNWVGYQNWEGWGDGQKLPSPAIWAVATTHSDRVFVGTERGPGWVDSRSGNSGQLYEGSRWKLGQLGALGVNRDGSVWAGSFGGGILKIDARTGGTKKIATLSAFILSGLQAPNGDVYYATMQGLWEQNAGAAPHRIPAVDALMRNAARVEAGCAAPDGALWFLANNKLLRFKDGQWKQPPMDGLPKMQGRLISLSCAKNGDIWLTGQLAGALRVVPADDRLEVSKFLLPPELRTLAPLAIFADSRGWVWLGSDQGLAVWNGQSWRHVTQESGLIWNDVDQGILSEGSDGSIWVGTSGGLAHILHPERIFEPFPLALSLEGIQRGTQSIEVAHQITLPWSAAPLSIQVVSPAMRNRSELLFKLHLEGLNEDWIESKDGRAIFSNLPPGNYTLMAIAENPSLNAYSETVKMQIRILPPWWRTYWFYALCGLAILLFIGAFDRLRARSLRERSLQLEQLVSERTHELEISREQLRIQATHDGLTGMLNRTGILRMLGIEMDRARRENRTLVAALVDFDHFKRINDTYGHLAGDEALRWFASAVGAATRPYDHAGRYGGEEFLLILTEIPLEVVEQRLAKLHANITNLQVHRRGAEFRVTCSIGVCVFDPTSMPGGGEAVLAIADQALYAAKAAGRNRVVFGKANDSKSREKAPDSAENS